MTALLIILGLFLAVVALVCWSLLRIAAWADRADEPDSEADQS